MSPIGDAFRNRIRQYPSLINCTTIDWFLEWPRESLIEVGNKFLMDLNLIVTITGENRIVSSLIDEEFVFSCTKFPYFFLKTNLNFIFNSKFHAGTKTIDQSFN